MEKINIAELIKDCPQGMELYSPIFGNVYLDKIRPHLAIVVTTDKKQGDFKEEFLYDGRYGIDGECMLFPSKDKTTWEGFQRPFKDGDIVRYLDTIAIFNGWGDETLFRTYVTTYLHKDSTIDVAIPLFGKAIRKDTHFATEKEKQKLFDAIKANGYKWNSKTKTLEIEPKFKVGNIVQNKDGYKVRITEVNIEDECYGYESLIANGLGGISFNEQNDWELVPNKTETKVEYPGRNREDVLFDSIIWHLRNSVNNGKQHLSGGDCEAYFREVVKKNNENKMKNVLAELLEHIKNTSKEELEKEFNELGEWSNIGPTVEEFMAFCECVNKKPKYPDNYEECVRIAKNIHGYDIHIDVPAYGELMESFVKLLICQDAYWKIAGEELGLDRHWEPDWTDDKTVKYGIWRFQNTIIKDNVIRTNRLLVFPTVEMRDTFYVNFKDLIEQCKELL